MREGLRFFDRCPRESFRLVKAPEIEKRERAAVKARRIVRRGRSEDRKESRSILET